MQKIDVLSKADVYHVEKLLQSELKKNFIQQLFESPKEKEKVEKYMKKLLDCVFEDVHHNVQVAGFDWNESQADESEQYEPFSEETSKDLQELQLKLDESVLKISKYRKEIPAQLTELIDQVHVLRQKQLQQIVLVGKENTQTKNASRLETEDLKELDSVISSYQSNIEMMNELKKKLPNVVNKMRRVKQVLEAMPSMDQSQTEKILRQDFTDIYGVNKI